MAILDNAVANGVPLKALGDGKAIARQLYSIGERYIEIFGVCFRFFVVFIALFALVRPASGAIALTPRRSRRQRSSSACACSMPTSRGSARRPTSTRSSVRRATSAASGSLARWTSTLHSPTCPVAASPPRPRATSCDGCATFASSSALRWSLSL